MEMSNSEDILIWEALAKAVNKDLESDLAYHPLTPPKPWFDGSHNVYSNRPPIPRDKNEIIPAGIPLYRGLIAPIESLKFDWDQSWTHLAYYALSYVMGNFDHKNGSSMHNPTNTIWPGVVVKTISKTNQFELAYDECLEDEYQHNIK
ncbi:MAG: hypothetical protein WCP38_04995, partial [Chloroflexota bacterium]